MHFNNSDKITLLKSSKYRPSMLQYCRIQNHALINHSNRAPIVAEKVREKFTSNIKNLDGYKVAIGR